MNIVLIGKFPPIQGGVSVRMHGFVRSLVEEGHNVHLITNANEAVLPFRLWMRPRDWDSCQSVTGPGQFTIHWTETADRSQAYIPMAIPFVSKLAGLGIETAKAINADVIFSFYVEPYAVAGHLISQALHIPHVIKTSGSDTGRLWQHPQIGPLYDQIFRAADAIIARNPVAGRLIKNDVFPDRIHAGAGFAVDASFFGTDKKALNIEALVEDVSGDPQFRQSVFGRFDQDRPVIGVYGKLGPKKGTFDLLNALAHPTIDLSDANLLIMGQGWPNIQNDVRKSVDTLGLKNRVLQIPFLPHCRVPEFLHRCVAVCCLEQDFPIAHHTPVIAREVLASGTCLIASTEILGKLPLRERLAHGYNCIAIDDVRDAALLASTLRLVLDHRNTTQQIGERGQHYALELQKLAGNAPKLSDILQKSIERRQPQNVFTSVPLTENPSFVSLIDMVLGTLDNETRNFYAREREAAGSTVGQLELLETVLRKQVHEGKFACAPYLDIVRFECLITALEGGVKDAEGNNHQLNFLNRLDGGNILLSDDRLPDLMPFHLSPLRMERFTYDINSISTPRNTGTFPERFSEAPCVLAIQHDLEHHPLRIVMLKNEEAAVLKRCDGSNTIESLAALEAVTRLFEIGLVGFHSADN